MTKGKALEAILVIVIGFLILFLLYEKNYFLYIAIVFGIIGVINEDLTILVAKGWFKLGQLLGFIVSKVVLATMFYFLLVPIALLHNVFNKDSLRLKRSKKSLWNERNHVFTSADFKNTW